MIEWLGFSGLGILFGLPPAWWSCSAITLDAITRGKKGMPDLLAKILGNRYPGTYLGLIPKPYYVALLKILSVIWVVSCVIGYNYLYFGYHGKHNFYDMVFFETSFPAFLLFTWIFPMYLLTRFVRKQKANELKTYEHALTTRDRKRFALLFTLTVLLLFATFTLFLRGQQVTSPGMIMGIIGFGILATFLIIINIRLLRK